MRPLILSPDVRASPDETLAREFPSGFTIRDEANALTAYAFRDGPIEDLHAGISSPLTDDPTLSRITNDEMRKVMIAASEKLAGILTLRDSDPEKYMCFMQAYGLIHCTGWIR